MSFRTYDPGDLVVLLSTFTDPENGDALVAPTTVVCSVEKPDGTVVTPAVTNPSTGVYRAAVTPVEDEHGVWWYRFVGSGTVQAVEQRKFRVRQQQV